MADCANVFVAASKGKTRRSWLGLSRAPQWLEVPEDSDLSDSAPILVGLDTQITKVQRALERAKDDYYEADDPSEHRNRMERYRLEFADLEDRRAESATLRADAHAKAERLTDLAKLSERATGRLESMAPAQS